MRFPDSFCLLQEPWQGSPVFRLQEVATPGKQATNTHRILGYLVATHRAIAFFHPPADGTLTGIVGAIERFSLGSFPLAIARQAMPESPAVEKEESQAIGHTLMLARLRRCGVQIAPVHRFQFRSLLPLSTLDQFALLALRRLPPALDSRQWL